MAKMWFWNAQAHISQKMYKNSVTAMWIFRCLGIFPLQVKHTSKGLFLKFNPLYALYSCFLGTATLGGLYYRIYEELISDTKSSQNVRTVDKFVRFIAINAFCLMVFYNIFVMPTQLLKFFKYIKYINRVDNLINMKFSKSNQYKSIFILIAPLLCNVTTSLLDLFMLNKFFNVPFIGTLVHNMCYYATYIIALTIFCCNRYIANCLEIRVSHMNKILNEEYIKIVKGEGLNHVSAVSRVSQVSEDAISVIYQKQDITFAHIKAYLAIVKISQAYFKWMKAAAMINHLFGFINTVALLAVLCQLVASKYFIIMALEGRSHNVLELIDWTAIFSVQIMKVMLIIEPWYFCVTQMEALKQNICNLSSRNLDRYCREKVNSFIMTLCLCPYSFTACGMFNVDRLLYTTLIDTVVTFLVISLEAGEEDPV